MINCRLPRMYGTNGLILRYRLAGRSICTPICLKVNPYRTRVNAAITVNSGMVQKKSRWSLKAVGD